MSENDHAAAIRQHAGELQDSYKSVYHIIRLAQAMQAHAEALSAQLAEAETYPDAGAWQQMVQENDDLRAQLAEAEAGSERWKRMALAHDAYEDALLCGLDGNEQERVREELRAAHTDLKAHGDLGDES